MQFPWSESPIGDDPLFLVDGVPVFDADLIAKLKCSDLLSVGVIYDKYFFQYESFDGILDIHSKAGDASVLKIPKNICSVNFTGIQQVNRKSDLSIPDAKSREPYFKTQLYWNPSIGADATGTRKVEFWSSDNAGDYVINIQGILPDGSLCSFQKKLKVR